MLLHRPCDNGLGVGVHDRSQPGWHLNGGVSLLPLLRPVRTGVGDWMVDVVGIVLVVFYTRDTHDCLPSERLRQVMFGR